MGCGDLTSRILAALIEENIIAADQVSNFAGENGVPNGKMDIENGFGDQSKLPIHILKDESLPLPHDAPPTYDYSPQAMLTLEGEEFQNLSII